MNNGLNKLNTGKSHSDKGQAQRAAKEVLKFILTNKKHFKPGDEKHLRAAVSMDSQLGLFSPKQLSYVDGIYEILMGDMGYPSYKGQKSDFSRKLRLK